MTMKINSFEVLMQEYDRVDSVIHAYTNRQINYMNFTLLIFGGSFIYLIEKEVLNDFKEYYPYFLFLVYGLFAMDIYRIQIYQGYRKYLSDIINRECNRHVINTPFLTFEFILKFKNNWFYPFYTSIW